MTLQNLTFRKSCLQQAGCTVLRIHDILTLGASLYVCVIIAFLGGVELINTFHNKRTPSKCRRKTRLNSKDKKDVEGDITKMHLCSKELEKSWVK